MITPSSLLRIASRQRIGLLSGPVVFVALLLFSPFDISPSANAALASTLWIATGWVTEAIPISATSLLPIVVVPPTGAVDVAAATAPYADPVVFLLLAGFLLALGIDRWDLHRRIALAIVGVVGIRSNRLLLGFMVATAFLSMWSSNSATAMLLVPLGTAVIVAFGTVDEEGDPSHGHDIGGELVTGVRAVPESGHTEKLSRLARVRGAALRHLLARLVDTAGEPPSSRNHPGCRNDCDTPPTGAVRSLVHHRAVLRERCIGIDRFG